MWSVATGLYLLQVSVASALTAEGNKSLSTRVFTKICSHECHSLKIYLASRTLTASQSGLVKIYFDRTDSTQMSVKYQILTEDCEWGENKRASKAHDTTALVEVSRHKSVLLPRSSKLAAKTIW